MIFAGKRNKQTNENNASRRNVYSYEIKSSDVVRDGYDAIVIQHQLRFGTGFLDPTWSARAAF